MRFKSLALISAATTALGIGFASPALARGFGDGDGGFGDGGFGHHGFFGPGISHHHHLDFEGGGGGPGFSHAGLEHFRHFRHFERSFEPRERECHFFCTAPIFDREGREVANLRVHVGEGRIEGELHPLREFEAKGGEEFPVHGFCHEFGGESGEGGFGEGRFGEGRFGRGERGERGEHERDTELTEWTRVHALHHEEEESEEPESEPESVETHARETTTVPSGAARTGFGGSSDSVSLPLAAGALSLIAGGIGLGGLAARRRLSGVRS